MKAAAAAPSISIIINNFNYGRFLRECIDSALAQSHPDTEVIVVDDGSTDESRSILATYGARIIPVLKDNGGQGSAFNAGFAIAKGQVVIFLDSDDALLADTAQRVFDAFRSGPCLAKVQYRLAYVDEGGTPLGKTEPPLRWGMPSGDLRVQAVRYYQSISPPTSGNAFAASVLSAILPVPEELFRTAADAYVNPLAEILGPVASLEGVGGRYRMHGSNDSRPTSLDLRRIRVGQARQAFVRAKQKQFLRKIHSIDIPDIPFRDTTFIRVRMVSLKIDPENHPYPDRLAVLCLRGCYASLASSRLRWYERVLSFLWFAAVSVAPVRWARVLSEQFYLAEKRGVLLTWFLSGLREGWQFMRTGR